MDKALKQVSLGCSACAQNIAHVLAPFLWSDFGYIRPSEWLWPYKISACSSSPTFPVSLRQPTGSSLWLGYAVLLWRISTTKFSLNSHMLQIIVELVGIPFHRPTTDTWCFSLFPFPLRFSGSGNSQRIHSSSLWDRSRCVGCSCLRRRRNIYSHLGSHSAPVPIHPNVLSRACCDSGFARWGVEVGVASLIGRLHKLGLSGH